MPDELVPPAQSSSPGDVDICVTDDGVLVSGEPAAVQGVLDQLAEFGRSAVDIADFDRKKVTDMLATAAGAANAAASFAAASGRIVILSKQSADLARTAGKIPTGTGYFHGVLTGGGKFAHSLQWRPVAGASPAGLMALQVMALQQALQAAIAGVEEAVVRVEGKVDSLLTLAGADRAGDILGHYAVLRRMSDELDERNGVLPDADWDSVASLGPTLQIAVERLREHARRVLGRFDADTAIGQRADELRNAVTDQRLGETLRLLVVAEESLHLWQRIRLARIITTEPEHTERALESARSVLADNREADTELVARARTVVSDFAAIKPLEFIRKFSANKVKVHSQGLREDVDAFALARTSQVDAWVQHNDPTVGDALTEIQRRGAGAAARALGAGAGSIDRFSRRLQQVAEPRTTSTDTDTDTDTEASAADESSQGDSEK